MRLPRAPSPLAGLSLLLLWSGLEVGLGSDRDLYELFGVAKDATDREIRRAFKKMAVATHPDKNPDDPEADGKFIEITRAYEVLKDAESRKQYDLYGHDGVKSRSHRTDYQSWSYYRDQFGIYDDDPEIITLNQADYDNSVAKSSSAWFVNFYSPGCSHCHHVAPAWRRMARALRGVVRVGAVNCDEDWGLCRREGVRSYPTLVYYPSREHFTGDRSEEAMTDFVLDRLTVSVARLTGRSWDPDRRWVVFLCEGRCSEDTERIKVAAILTGLVEVGEVSCGLEADLCSTLLSAAEAPHGRHPPAVVYWLPADGDLPPHSELLGGGEGGEDAQELGERVLGLLPDTPLLGANQLEAMLRDGSPSPWLVHFHMGASVREDLEWRRLPVLTPGIEVGRVHCGRAADICARMHVLKYPTFAVFKEGGGYEVHHGRTSAHDVADFARDAAGAANVRTLTPEEFSRAVAAADGGSAWVVDFFAPWCPPCLRLLPQLRSASRAVGSGVSFGLVDCTVHTTLCRSQEVSSYPTTVLYNSTSLKQRYHGDNTAEAITEFLRDMMNPVVVRLTGDNFHATVGSKRTDELWLVDFFAPWCGPCQQLAPEWRKLAKMLVSYPHVHVGSVDCVAEGELCSRQAVRSYPTIRLYPLGSEGLSAVALFSGYQRDAFTLRKWLFHFLPSVVAELTPDTFRSEVVEGRAAWLVDFYAPWCGHCAVFEPEFENVAERLTGVVKCGKLNCEKYRAECQRAGVHGYPSVLLYHGAGGRSHVGVDIPSQAGDEIVRRTRELIGREAKTHDEL